MNVRRTVITGTGSYIPTELRTNADFINHLFYTEAGEPLHLEPSIIIEKFTKITGIAERRYASADLNASDLAAKAALEAIKDSATDPESLDMIIVAQNFGDVTHGSVQSDAVPALASRVKQLLQIRNPGCIAYDILFGCPGWIQGVIQADAFFMAGIARRAVVIGAETLSRVIDSFDRDSMIFSDGAGAAVLERKEVEETGSGILSSSAMSHCVDEVDYISMRPSYSPTRQSSTKYLKMKGRKVYEYALKLVPLAMKDCFDKCGAPISELKKIFIHQANEKMDDAIVAAFYKLYNVTPVPAGCVPMSVHYLGNSSVATVPTLYDMVRKQKDENHSIEPGDLVLFASVGAGMNINAICYRI